jgi:prolyl oligopeptidase
VSDGESADPYLWLEEVEGERALAWVRERNNETLAALTGDADFDDRRRQLLEVLDSTERIPDPGFRGGFLYNFWRDEEHPRGLWRRTTVDGFRAAEPAWDVLFDVDAVAAAENENWVWHGPDSLGPEYTRFLLSLSRGGADASVVREYDLTTRAFVPGGFELAEAKSSISWIDLDHVFVGTDFGPGSLTDSGYPRIAKRWTRGTPLAQAETVYEGQSTDVSVTAWHDQTPGFPRDFVQVRVAFFEVDTYLLRGGELVKIDVPRSAVIDVQREWLLIRLRDEWSVEGTSYASGSLLAADVEAFLAGGRDLTVLFEPAPDVALNYHTWTRHHLMLGLLRDVHSELVLLDPADGWRRSTLDGVPPESHTTISDTDPDRSDELLLASTGFTEPTTLRYGQVGGALEVLKREPSFFDIDGLSVRQFFATSPDATLVPYFVVGAPDRTGPTLLSAYGGFEISLTPYYDGTLGRAWLSRGGTYVVANIRGGGEYGPDWHRAAMREKRPLAFADCAAVAADLVDRGITTPERLGFEGGSNGGLLAGVMLTRYPEHFGAIVGMVPLLDMRRYHKLLAGASWIAEYGDPDNPDDWGFLRRYSPYQNLHSGLKLPPALWVTSTRDDRVHPGHARKMAARMRELGFDVTYYENIEGGHGAAADNAQLAFREALAFEFLWRALGP